MDPNLPSDSEGTPEGEPHNIAGSGKPPRERIVDALLAHPGRQVVRAHHAPEVASTAGVTLADMRGEFGSTLRSWPPS